MDYQVLKAIHLIFIISWFAGMFYIFRLFVYHTHNWKNDSLREVFVVMERKLLKLIILPAALASLASGIAMLMANPLLVYRPWIWLKFGFVVVLFLYSGYSYWVHLQFKQNRMVLTEKACRLINEVPTLALVVISFLVFIKPIFSF